MQTSIRRVVPFVLSLLAVSVALADGPNPPTAADPNISITPPTRNFGTGGGAVAIVTAGSGTWQASVSDSWITLNVSSGQAGYPVAYTVSVTTNVEPRTGYVYVSGHIHTVTQDGVGATISPENVTYETVGGTGSISVAAPDRMAWQARANDSWLGVSKSSGTGPETLTYTVSRFDEVSTRQGTLTVAGNTFSVFQYGRRMKLGSYSSTQDYLAHVISITVNALAITEWSVRPNASWISIVDAGKGKGGDLVTIAIAENPSWKARTGTVKIGTETFTVMQKGRMALEFAIDPATTTASVEGANGLIAVTATPDLPWSAASQASWLTVYAASASGAGNGNVAYTVSPNPTLYVRTGTIKLTPGDALATAQTHTVKQPAAVSALSMSGYEFAAAGESCALTVSLSDIVEWQIENTNDWLTVSGSTNRVGPGTVTLQAAPNNTVYPRSGTVTIARWTFKVSQKGRGVEVGYETMLFGADGGSDTLSIHPEGNASWTAVVSDPTWITVFGSNSGTGDGRCLYIVSSFAGDETVRTGTITVGGKVVCITQRAFDLGISPKSATVAGESGTGNFKVSTGSGNAWQALVPDPWISLMAGNDAGTGNGTVKYRYAANATGTARKGKIIVAGEVFTLQQRTCLPFPEAQDAAEAASFLSGAADGRLGRQIRGMEEYEAFRAWVTGKGLDRQAVKDSPHAWISYALGAERLFGAEPTMQIDGVSVARNGAKGAENGVAMDVSVVVHDGGSEVAVDAGKVAGLFEATGDLSDWEGDAKLSATATQTGSDGATMQFRVVPGDGKTGEAFLRLGLEEGDARQRQTISFATIGEKTWRDRVNLSALASSGGPVTFEVVSGPGKLEGDALSFTSSGLVKVQAMQPGNDIWLPATATQTVTVGKIGQTISFAPIGVQWTTNRVDLSATATSGLPVTYEVVSGPGVIGGNVLTFSGPGEVEVRAVQAGNERWLPASATQTMPVVADESDLTYMVVDLSAGNGEGTAYPVSYLGAEPEGGWTDEYKTTKLVLRRIEAGTFTMGSPSDELGRDSDETQHEVTLTQPFYIGVFEVTQKQYELVMGSNPSEYKGDMRPVESVAWNTFRGYSYAYDWPNSTPADANTFVGRIRKRTGLAFDLPTEAQWEYACRAGTTTALNSGKNLKNTYRDREMAAVGRYDCNEGYDANPPDADGKGGYNSNHTTVGSYLPNAWGLYDMHGNVCEWCSDFFALDLGTAAVTDPKGPTDSGSSSGKVRVLRGGCWRDKAQYCRSACRGCNYPDGDGGSYYGFRLACFFLGLGPKEGDARQRQIISFDSMGEPTWKDRVTLAAVASSGEPVTFELVSGPGKLEGNVLSFTGPGTVKVQAVQAGNDMWLPATATQTVTVAKAGQTISFAAIGPQTSADRVELSATATSGLPVTFEVVSGPGKVAGNVLTFTAGGTVEVRAVQAGNEQWLPATATQMVTVIDLSKRLYMVVDLSAGSGDGSTYPVSYLGTEPQGGWPDEYKTRKLVLRRISPGSYTMGSPSDETGRHSNETQHEVTITQPFYIGVFEVTQKQWELVMGTNFSYFSNAHYYKKRPVECVSWNVIRGTSSTYNWPATSEVDATSFMGKLRAKTVGGMGLLWDLPTEAQWEYACRAGTTTAFNNGTNLGSTSSSDTTMNTLGRYYYNLPSGYRSYSTSSTTDTGTAEVGSYLPNAWGLYDMHGNVREWCLDWYAEDLGTAAVTDPKGATSGSDRVLRGGCWGDNAQSCRSANRRDDHSWWNDDLLGFRLACVPGL